MTHTPANTPAAGGEVSLADLHAANTARQAEWCPDQVPDLSFRGNELGGECGEAQNVIKKLERERLGWRGSRATVEQLAEELADVVICADLCAVTAGIDLGAAVVAKFNATSEKVGLTTKLAAIAAPTPQADGGVVKMATLRRLEALRCHQVCRAALDQSGCKEPCLDCEDPEDRPYKTASEDLSRAAGAAAPPLNTGSAVGGEPRRMAQGCCSAISPCSHQQRDPYSICGICQKAARLTDTIMAAPAEAGEDLAGLSARVVSAVQAYLRVCSSGGMPRAKREQVETAVKQAAKLGYFDDITPAASRPVEQGDPVAWAFEDLDGMFDLWEQKLRFSQPDANPSRRNIRPLYAHPAPAAERPAVGRSASPHSSESEV